MSSALRGLRFEARACPSCGTTDSVVVRPANLDTQIFGEFTFSSRKQPDGMHYRLLLCPECELLYASPAPSEEALHGAYREASYDSGEEARFASLTYAALLRTVLGELPDAGGALDIGAGDGAFLRHLVAAGIEDVVGIEPSAAPVASAAPDVRGLIRSGMFCADDFEPSRFRLVTAFQTMEHVADPLALCRDANRLLKTGGALIVVSHNRKAPANRLLGRRSPIYDVEHLQLFCPESLRRLLERAGFTRIRLRAITNRYPVGYWVRLLPLPDPLKRSALTALRRSGLSRLPVGLPAGNFAAIAFKH
jgi:SAM-dependent methyltransferase